MKIKAVFIWTVYLVILVTAHGMADLTDASAAVSVSPTSLTYQATVGGPNQSASLVVTNTGSAPQSISWSNQINWLVDIQPGNKLMIPPGNFREFTLTASPAGLAAGNYFGTAAIFVQGNGSFTVLQVPITLKVTSGTSTPIIGVSPTSMTFSGTVGGANPAAKTISIANTGSGTLTWSASRNAFWLTLNPISGTGTGSVTVSVNTSNLQAGTYNSVITVSAIGATTQSIPVTLTVTAASTGTGTPPPPSTGSATLTWNASPSTTVSGYKIYATTTAGLYGGPIAILGNVTSYQATGLGVNTTYYFVVTAVDGAGRESLLSNEVYKTIY